MIIYDGEFKFSDSYRDMSSLELVEPFLMKSSSGDMYPIGKVPAKSINYNSGLQSSQFSNNLYRLDDSIWRMLRDKKRITESVDEYYSNNKVMIINDNIISVVDNQNYLTEFLDSIDKFTENDGLTLRYRYDEEEFQLLVIDDESSTGFIIRYYLSYNWISVFNVMYVGDSELFISPYPVTDKPVENDISILLDDEYLLNQCSMVSNDYQDFCDRGNINMSYSELISRLKSDFNIRITGKVIDPSDYLEDKDFSLIVSRFVDEVLGLMYQGVGYEYVNSSHLKRSVNFSPISYSRYYNIISNMYLNNNISINSLISVSKLILDKETNHDKLV
jgi:uncharacterized protein YbaR (Trm112 family)